MEKATLQELLESRLKDIFSIDFFQLLRNGLLFRFQPSLLLVILFKKGLNLAIFKVKDLLLFSQPFQLVGEVLQLIF